MKLTTTKMTKRMTLLLAAIFSWLFVGSLIMFHQEHVLGKHLNAISHHYIVPKSKEKDGYLLKQQPTIQKISLSAGLQAENDNSHQGFFPRIDDKLAVSPIGLFSDQPPGVIFGLRAPPVA